MKNISGINVMKDWEDHNGVKHADHDTDPEIQMRSLLSSESVEKKKNGHQSPQGDIIIEQEKQKPLVYRINESPPLHLLLLFAFQQSLLSIGSPLATAIIVSEVVCAKDDEILKAQILSASFLMIGLSTFAMSTFGVRLPVFQGPASTYLIPLIAMRELPEWKCPKMFESLNSDNTTTLVALMANDTLIPARDVMLDKINKLSGSLMLAGALHFFIGITGLVGVLLRFIGPVTIVPAITLVGLYIYELNVKFCETSWIIASVTCITNLILSLFLRNRNTPIPLWHPKRGFYILWYPFHQVFSVLLSIIVGWILSAILTDAGALSNDPKTKNYLARTDAKLHVVDETDWLTFPYPGKYGSFLFSGGGFISFFIATISSILDSVGDYNAVARTAQVVPPPKYAFNRGIAVEGLMSFLSGTLGCCHATVSYGGNIGAMGITRVVSRRVFQVCGLIYIIFAFFGKVGALFITIPIPVIGGSSIITMGIFIGLVLSYLQTIDLNSFRNLSIIGTALLLGLMLPYWIKKNPDAIDTGSPEFNTSIKMLLSNPSFVGGFFACFMDNAVPGTLKERGLLHQMKELENAEAFQTPGMYEDGLETYRLPYIPEWFLRSKIAKYVPIFDYQGK